MPRNWKIYVFLLLLAGVIYSCGEEADDENVITAEETEDLSRVTLDPSKINALIESFPSPMEMAATIEDMKVPYSKKYLVPTELASDFDSNFEKALGLGMLSADLGYLNVYARKNAIVEYLTTIKRLADALDVDQFFDFQTLKRLATNSTDLDSLMTMSTTSYLGMDRHLRETRRSDLSALMITGVWLEGQYLSCKVNTFKENQKVKEIIVGQKDILKELLTVLDFFKDKARFNPMNESFNELLTLYDEVEIKLIDDKEDQVYYDKDSIQVIIPGEYTEINYTPETFKKISDKIIQIRNNLISLK